MLKEKGTLGFTLVEVLVVLAILSVVLSMVILSVPSNIGKKQLGDAAERFIEFVDYGRALSVITGKSHSILYEGESLRIVCNDTKEEKEHLALAKGVQLCEWSVETEACVNTEGEIVRFHNSGVTKQKQVMMSDRSDQIGITVRSLYPAKYTKKDE